MTAKHVHEDYTVGWICPLEVEQIAAIEMLDEEHKRLPQPVYDQNSYTLGSIQGHNVVVAGLPTTGNCSTATVVAHMTSTFPKIRFGLLVGIGGGIPIQTDAGHIKLGHVVVSKPSGEHSGAIQYDHGKAEAGEFRRTGFLRPPPNVLLNAAQRLAVNRARAREDPLQRHLKRIDIARRGLRRYKHPGRDKDELYNAAYLHRDKNLSCGECCDPNEIITREDGDDEDTEEWIEIHRGTIASGELVVRDGLLRDALAKEYNILCFEMEAAGALNDFPCLVIRGISDYSDSHKNDKWHGYAAATAAAYARELFYWMPIDEVAKIEVPEKIFQEIIDGNRTIAVKTEQTKVLIGHLGTSATLNNLPWASGATFDSFENSDEERFCLKDTRTELFRAINAWMDSSDKSIFWLNGMAGTGKSTISRTLAQRLSGKGVLGATFFFKRGGGDCGHAQRFFTTIVAQLVMFIPRLVPQVKAALEKDVHIGTKRLEEQFQQLLLKPLIAIKEEIKSPVVIIIDALDECEPLHQVVTIMELLAVLDSQLDKVHIFLTSRPENVLFEEFQDIKHEEIVLHDVGEMNVTHDIALFLQHQFRKICEQNKDDLEIDWPGKERLTTLTLMAQPLFIFAATICRFIADRQHDPKARLDAVLFNKNDGAFDQVHQIYRPILDNILTGATRMEKPILLEKFKQIVGPIVVLLDDLSMKSLAALLGIDLREVKMTLNRLQSVLNVPKDVNTPVRLLHASFADFLLDDTRRGEHEFWIDSKDAHAQLTKACLNILVETDVLSKPDICGLKNPGTQRSDIDPSLPNRLIPPEAQYACRFYVAHLKYCSSSDYEDRITTFLERRFLFWFEALSLLGRAFDVADIMSDLGESVGQSKNTALLTLIEDGRSFSLRNNYVVNTAPLQLYHSCILFDAEDSIKRMDPMKLKWLKKGSVNQVVDRNVLHTIETGTDSITSMAFSPDSAILAFPTPERICLWDVKSCQIKHTLDGGNRNPIKLALSFDGQMLASISQGSFDIEIWSLVSKQRHRILHGHSSRVTCLAFSPRDFLLASGSADGTVSLWNFKSGEHLYCLSLFPRVLAVAFSHDGQLLACSCDFKAVEFWDLSSSNLQEPLDRTPTGCEDLFFSPDGKLFTYRDWKTVIIFNIELKRKLVIEGVLCFLPRAFSPDFKLLAAVSRNSVINIWDTSSWTLLQNLVGHRSDVQSLAFSPDGLQLASASSDKTILVWNITLVSTLISFPTTREKDLIPSRSITLVEQRESGLDMRVTTMALSLDGSYLASTAFGNQPFKDPRHRLITIWLPRSGELLKTLDCLSPVQALSFAPDGFRLAAGLLDYTIRIWDVRTELTRQHLQCQSRRMEIACSVNFAADGKLLASGHFHGAIMLWDTESGQLLQYIDAHKSDIPRVHIESVAISPDSTLLASTQQFGATRLWNIAEGRPEWAYSSLSACGSVCFSPDGEILASCSSGLIHLLDVGTGQELQTIEVPSEFEVSSISFNGFVPRIDTNLGSFKIKKRLAKHYLHEGKLSPCFTIREDWLLRDNKKFLWIPPDYRGIIAYHEEIVAIGLPFGGVIFLDLSSKTEDS